MFVAQQAARSRVVRTTFVVACLIPCAGLLVWAGWRRSGVHRDGLRKQWSGAVGMPVSVERVEHVRPGSLRAHGVSVEDDRGEPFVGVRQLELEVSATEIRVRLPELDCTPEAIAAFVGLGRAWLDEPARFDRNVVMDVGRLGFSGTVGVPGEVGDGVGVRIECVGTETGRAIRFRTEPETDEGFVVQSLADTDGGGRRLVVRGNVARPLPVAAITAALGWSAGTHAAGAATRITGAIEAEVGARGWDGVFSAILTGVELSSVTSTLPWHADGRATVVVDECRLAAGRVVSVRGGVEIGPGRVEQAGLESLVSALGCRPGAGWKPVANRGDVAFVRGAARLELDRRGLRIASESPAGILVTDGGALLEPPVAGVSLDRVARALSPTTLLAVPATPMSGWLLSVFPFPQPSAPATDDAGAGAQQLPKNRDLPRGPLGDSGPAAPRR